MVGTWSAAASAEVEAAIGIRLHTVDVSSCDCLGFSFWFPQDKP